MAAGAVPSPPLQNVLVADTWGVTQVDVVKFNYTWTVKNFSLSCDNSKLFKYLKSSTFPPDETHKSKWYILMKPNGSDEESNDFISLYLYLLSCDEAEVRAKFKLSILNTKFKKTICMEFSQVYRFEPGEKCGFRKFALRRLLFDQANSLLPEDKLTILCEVSVLAGETNTSGQSNRPQFKLPERRLSDDLDLMFNSGRLSDFTLAVGEREFRVHKAILAARSPVFAAMFEHDMKERKLNRADISDIDVEVMSEMLRFIYTGRAPNLDKMADDLLVAADKYALERLKVMCEQNLCKKITVETATDLLILADLRSAEQLKAYTIEFIGKNITEVMCTAEWKEMTFIRPYLIADTFQTIADLHGTERSRPL